MSSLNLDLGGPNDEVAAGVIHSPVAIEQMEGVSGSGVEEVSIAKHARYGTRGNVHTSLQ